MAANRRIYRNVVATYGRSLYVLVIGVLRVVDGDGVDGLTAVEMDGKGMNTVWQRLQRFGWGCGIGGLPCPTVSRRPYHKGLTLYALNIQTF